SGLSSGGLSPLNNTFTPGLSPAVLPTVPAAGLSAAGTAVKEHGFPTVNTSIQLSPAIIASPVSIEASPKAAAVEATPVLTAPKEELSARQTLETSVQEIVKTDSPSEKRSLLSVLFSGARRRTLEQTDSVVIGSDSAVRASLAPSEGRAGTQNLLSEPKAPASPKSTRTKTASILRWALPILAMTALVLGLDFGTKFFAAKFLFTAFHECAWRVPLMKIIIPFITVTAAMARNSLPRTRTAWRWSPKELKNGRLGFYREAISGTDDMLKDHPSLKWAIRLYGVAIALMLGGLLGNGLDALRLSGALDWIPLGRSLMNLADLALLPGLALFQLMTHFFVQAGRAHHAGKLLHFDTGGFLGLPLVGFFIAWAFGTAPSEGALTLALKNVGFLYLMGFSMLLGISRLAASLIVNHFAARFTKEQGKSA
ncbi:MAG: hypothetical protein HY922_11050, partial [Elusimicrobia bacterium]|nr:hypothetical protein [Elusimicrobiota bacterium]